jgi:adenylate kinase family enzyme
MEVNSETRNLRRINVIGTSGAGKSTFSKRLAEVLNYPYIEMDKIFWEPNWKWPSDEKFFSKLKSSLNQETWVLDGNYTRSVPIKWEQVDLIIWLDYSFPRTLIQAVKRAIIRSLTKEELWEGTENRESFTKSFLSKESIIWWTITTHKKNRLKYESYLMDPAFSHLKFIRLRSHAEAENFLKTLSH